MNLASAQLKGSAERYETLRRHFLENRRLLADAPLGLTLLLREGMAVWIRAWQSSTESAADASAPAPRSGIPPIPASSAWQQELTRLIARMTAAHIALHTT